MIPPQRGFAAIRHFLDPRTYGWLFREYLLRRKLRRHPNQRGAHLFPPGHYYSPLLDIEALTQPGSAAASDGAEFWEHLPLEAENLRSYYEDLLERFPPPPFPKQKSGGFRYFSENVYFVLSDAVILSGIIRKEVPGRIIEVGSGFSSAVMLDTPGSDKIGLTFIEPYPDRLQELLSPADLAAATLLRQPIQQIPPAFFDVLEARDILFVDSSHVAKVGSDVSFLLLRILPRLKPGVIIHFHDIFYPHTYPDGWLAQGIAWNESCFSAPFWRGTGALKSSLSMPSLAGCFPTSFNSGFRNSCPIREGVSGSERWADARRWR